MKAKIRIVGVVLLMTTANVVAQVAKPVVPRTVSQVVDFWVTNTGRSGLDQELTPISFVFVARRHHLLVPSDRRLMLRNLESQELVNGFHGNAASYGKRSRLDRRSSQGHLSTFGGY